MTIKELINLFGPNFSDSKRAEACIPRYAIICGVHIPPNLVRYTSEPASQALDIPVELAAKIMEIDAKERAGDKLAELGRGMAKVPSSISHSLSGAIDLLVRRATD